MWQDAINLEMSQARVAFQILNNDDNREVIGDQKIDCYLNFDVKIENLRRKARLVAKGSEIHTPLRA